MQSPLITKPESQGPPQEHGVTMVFVALAMVAIIAMAALSIDVITLYLARGSAAKCGPSRASRGPNLVCVGHHRRSVEWYRQLGGYLRPQRRGYTCRASNGCAEYGRKSGARDD